MASNNHTIHDNAGRDKGGFASRASSVCGAGFLFLSPLVFGVLSRVLVVISEVSSLRRLTLTLYIYEFASSNALGPLSSLFWFCRNDLSAGYRWISTAILQWAGPEGARRRDSLLIGRWPGFNLACQDGAGAR